VLEHLFELFCYHIVVTTVQKLQIGAWKLTALVAIVAVVAWGQANRWQIAGISNYDLFPLFGLLAFSVMWAHYIVAALRQYLQIDKAKLQGYFEATSLFVLGCILLHPGLLVWQLFRDGFGLPPGSYLNNYVARNAKWAALLGTVSLFIFLAYELRRIYSNRPWWRYAQYASDLAMFLIFLHALRLGGQLRPGWFRMIWWIYGISLLGALVYIYIGKRKGK
jgi:hypothetical protein